MMFATTKAFDILGDNIPELSTENETSRNKMGSYDEKWLEESKTKLLKQIHDEKRANLFMCRMEKQMKKKQYCMAYFRYDILWRSEFYKHVSGKDRVQDIYLNQ